MVTKLLETRNIIFILPININTQTIIHLTKTRNKIFCSCKDGVHYSNLTLDTTTHLNKIILKHLKITKGPLVTMITKSLILTLLNIIILLNAELAYCSDTQHPAMWVGHYQF